MGIRKRLSLGHPGLDELSTELHQAFCSSQLRHTSDPVLLHSTMRTLSHCPISMGNDSHSFLLKVSSSFQGFRKQKRKAHLQAGVTRKGEGGPSCLPCLCLQQKGGSHRQPSCKPKRAHYFERGCILFTWTY